MIRKRMLILLVGITTGVVVVGGTIGGLAGAGIFNTAVSQNKDMENEGTEQQEKMDSNLLKGKIDTYRAFFKYANDKNEIKSAEGIKSITASAIDSEINKLKSKLDGWNKIHFNNIYAEVKDKTTLTDEELAKVQDRLVETTDQFKAKLLTKFRWQIYEIFSKVDLKNNYKVKNEGEFNSLAADSQYSELDKLKAAISGNGQKYSVSAIKAINEVIKTINKIDVATNLTAEQQKLIQELIGFTTQQFFANVITKQVRQQVYRLLERKKIITGLNYDAFKRLSRDKQFEEIEKASNNIKSTNDVTTRIKKNAYANCIKVYRNNERIATQFLGNFVKNFLEAKWKAEQWLENYDPTA